MNSYPLWVNLVGEVLIGLLNCLLLGLLAWWADEHAPMWAFFLAFSIGIIQWTRPRYNRKQDFEK